MRFLVNNRGPDQLFRTNNIARKLGASKGVTLRNEDVKEALEHLAHIGHVDKVSVDDGGLAYKISQRGLEFWGQHAPAIMSFLSFE